MPLQEEYTVNLDAFHGPLDLLLYLIRRAEVDITDIPIAAITDQYVSFLRQVEEIDVEAAGDFLVMAASLIELKSRTLMPPEPGAADDAAGGGLDARPGDPIDPRMELVQQLLAYQRYRIASEALDDQRHAFDQRFSASARFDDQPDEEHDDFDLELEDAHLLDLQGAYERIVTSIDFTRLGDHTVELDDTPIELYEEDLLDRLRRTADRSMTLQSAFEGHNVSQRIGMFLATLELVRLRKVVVRQDDPFSEITLDLLDEEQAEPSIELSPRPSP